MKKLIDTLSSHVYQYLHEIVLIPIIVTVIGTLIYLLFTAKKTDKKEKIKGAVGIFLFLFSLMNILQLTILMRVNMHYDNPFENLLTGWLITSNRYKYDFSAVLNIILFVPFTFFLSYILKGVSTKNKIILSAAVSLAFTLLIETSQAIFHIGSFQISDIVYNTLGGFIGGMIYYIIHKLIHKKISSE